ncbi:MAG: hypothetical protein HYY06_01085 [Deltaproteobacteria bacterium]|nr:hypothetical protein [Deltaproteobacteria bacterium]
MRDLVAVLAVLASVLGSSCDCDPTEDGADAEAPLCHEDQFRCGEACCVAGSSCMSGVCCPNPLACGLVCCNADHVCVDQQCLECPNQLCAGQCCPQGWGCSETGCCRAEQICQGACCGQGRICEADQCVVDCGTLERCGPEGDPICCEGEDVCLRGACVTPGDPCRDDDQCEPGTTCDPDRQRCLPVADGGTPDAGSADGGPDGGPPDAGGGDGGLSADGGRDD